MQTITAAEYLNMNKAEPRRYNQEEKQLQMAFGRMLTMYEKAGKLSPNLIKWSYIANGEQRPAKTLANGKRFSKTACDLKKKGVKRGMADYFFCVEQQFHGFRIAFDLWLEAKSEKGSLTTEQKEFKKNLDGIFNSKFYEFRTVEEGLDILRNEKILLT